MKRTHYTIYLLYTVSFSLGAFISRTDLSGILTLKPLTDSNRALNFATQMPPQSDQPHLHNSTARVGKSPMYEAGFAWSTI